MFQQWIKALQPDGEEKQPDQYWVERLTALLLVEIARADSEVDAVEINAIERAIKSSCTSISAEEIEELIATAKQDAESTICLLYTSPSPRDATLSRMPSSA